jgi:hypothetical protein
MQTPTLGLLSSDVVLAAVLTFSLGLIAWGVPGVILLAWHASRRSRAVRASGTRLDYTYAPEPETAHDELAALSLPKVEQDNGIRPWVLGRATTDTPVEEKENRPAYLKLMKCYGLSGSVESGRRETAPTETADSVQAPTEHP